MTKFKLLLLIFSFSLLFWQPAQALLTMPTNDGIEAQVRQVFADAPAMIEVARCESGFRQYSGSGTVLRGGAGGNYIGIFQLSAGHAPGAQALGMDIYTTEGNLAYARHMYDTQGTKPWISCVPKNAPAPVVETVTKTVPPEPATPTVPSVPGTASQLTANLSYGMTNPQVAMLQQVLNALGFTVASSGAGSPGHETPYFGSLTREAVKKFQCSKGIACSGSESTTGYGRVGPMTRAALQAAFSQ